MDWLRQNQKKSQLGQLLIKKKLISEDQLNRAIDHQKTTGQRLGDILTEWNLVTARQIEGMLRKQRNVRRIAAIVTAFWAPIQVYAASVAPVPVVQVQTTTTQQKQSSLRMLNEEELSEIAGQGVLDDTLRSWLNLNGTANINATTIMNQGFTAASLANANKQTSGLQVLGNLVTLMDPLLGLLSAQTSVKDVVFNPASTASIVNPDGSITLSLPSSIGELSFNNIRVMGSSSGPSFGSINISSINLTGTTVTIKSH
jgi:hypothetical protein